MFVERYSLQITLSPCPAKSRVLSPEGGAKMEQLVSKYETVFIVNPNFTEEEAKAMLDKFTGIITANGGIVDNVNEWGKKKLAYPIDDLTDGYYYVVNFTSVASVPAELDRVFNITDGILRSLIVKLDK